MINPFSFIKKIKNKEIVIRTSAGIPFEHECRIENENVAIIDKSYNRSLHRSIRPVCGGPIEIHYVIRPIAEGETIAKCVRKPIGMKNNDENVKLYEYRIVVDDKLNITITRL